MVGVWSGERTGCESGSVDTLCGTMWSGLGQVGSGVAPSVQASSVLLLDTANLICANLAGKGGMAGTGATGILAVDCNPIIK